MVGIGIRYGIPLVLGLCTCWGSPLEQARVPGPEHAPLELAYAGCFFLVPLQVADPSGAVATISPLENGGADLLVHVHVTCKGDVRAVLIPSWDSDINGMIPPRDLSMSGLIHHNPSLGLRHDWAQNLMSQHNSKPKEPYRAH